MQQQKLIQNKQNKQQLSPFVKSCIGYGKFSVALVLGSLCAMLFIFFLYNLIAYKQPLYPILILISLLIIVIMVNNYSYNTFPYFTCFFLIAGIVSSVVVPIISKLKK